LAVSRKINGLSLNQPRITFSPNSARPRPQDEPPGDSLPGALTIQYTANSDYRKGIVGGEFRAGRQGRARRRRRKLGGERRRPHGNEDFRSLSPVKDRGPPAAARRRRVLDRGKASEKKASMRSTARWVGGGRPSWARPRWGQAGSRFRRRRPLTSASRASPRRSPWSRR
jgi:hypothetical protein